MALVDVCPLKDLVVNDDNWPTDSSVAQEEVEASVCRLYVLYKGGQHCYGEENEKEDAKPSSTCTETSSPENRLRNEEHDGNQCSEDEKERGGGKPLSCGVRESSVDADGRPERGQEGFEDRADSDSQSDDCESLASLDELVLHRDEHEEFLLKGLTLLSEGYSCLDASRPWLCFWVIHSLNLLGVSLEGLSKSKIVQFLARCQSPSGGFCGGPGQEPHLATSYAATMALCSLGTEEAYAVIDRERMRDLLVEMVDTNTGAVHMHAGGEVDVRAAYCALAIAHLTNINISSHYAPVVHWLKQCQTYEGGFGGVPGMEAHGGYAYCAYAALCLLDAVEHIDIKRLLHWVALRQMRLEGGFQGRTNKLVDGCYSFWQGGLFPLLDNILQACRAPPQDLLCSPEALQTYLLVCCQNPFGGLIDKPGKNRDFYHTCYCLSGLSTMQNQPSRRSSQRVVGHGGNALEPTHPLLNICKGKAESALDYFASRPLIMA